MRKAPWLASALLDLSGLLELNSSRTTANIGYDGRGMVAERNSNVHLGTYPSAHHRRDTAPTSSSLAVCRILNETTRNSDHARVRQSPPLLFPSCKGSKINFISPSFEDCIVFCFCQLPIEEMVRLIDISEELYKRLLIALDILQAWMWIRLRFLFLNLSFDLLARIPFRSHGCR